MVPIVNTVEHGVLKDKNLLDHVKIIHSEIVYLETIADGLVNLVVQEHIVNQEVGENFPI